MLEMPVELELIKGTPVIQTYPATIYFSLGY